ncbi:MAG: hypothetical protein WBA57_09780 [Elainellaceae cyanobacterium]
MPEPLPDSSTDFISSEFIPVITYVTPSQAADPYNSPPSKGVLDDALTDRPRDGSRPPEKAIGRVPISAKKLEDQMTQLLKSVGGVLGNAKDRAGDLAGMELEEVELSVEISGEGEVNLMGLGGIQGGASGAITLKFVRKS